MQKVALVLHWVLALCAYGNQFLPSLQQTTVLALTSPNDMCVAGDAMRLRQLFMSGLMRLWHTTCWASKGIHSNTKARLPAGRQRPRSIFLMSGMSSG